MKKDHGRIDYLLYVDQQTVGVIEAKPEGTTLSGVEWQFAMYADGLPPAVRLKSLTHDSRLPFVFEASGSETHFTNGFDPKPRARRLFSFPQPATMARMVRDAQADPEAPTWRGKVARMPELIIEGLRPAQVEAVLGIERSLGRAAVRPAPWSRWPPGQPHRHVVPETIYQAVYRPDLGGLCRELPPRRRASLLSLTAAHLGLPDLTRRYHQPGNPAIRWAHSLGAPHQTLTGHSGVVDEVVVGRIGGRDVIVCDSGNAVCV